MTAELLPVHTARAVFPKSVCYLLPVDIKQSKTVTEGFVDDVTEGFVDDYHWYFSGGIESRSGTSVPSMENIREGEVLSLWRRAKKR